MPSLVQVWQSERQELMPSELMASAHQVPLRLKWEDETEWFTLPLDPVVSVQGGNTIVRQGCAKQLSENYQRRGSVKEVWSQDDYEVNIAGMIIGADEYTFPDEALRRLRAYCEEQKVVEVQCELLETFGITRLTIEKYDFAHTAGTQNQQFAIKAYSDDNFSLLINDN